MACLVGLGFSHFHSAVPFLENSKATSLPVTHGHMLTYTLTLAHIDEDVEEGRRGDPMANHIRHVPSLQF